MGDNGEAELPQDVLDRLGLSKHDVDRIADYFRKDLREQMRAEFYRDVGQGVVRLGWKALVAIGAYLAWKGSGGSSGWIEFLRKVFFAG
ncbi:hypothetical protein [Pararobbsia silviterrae]|uniref:Uncharacterized protein n=1 Tax=Pararobbsia silviterrae TaxID=1792498 RepID=A0A494X6B8_9BURK|nr:hypothetical protein [Pararobbsia silviterrae]RKP43786.1 hypothetical protein D7S86_28360 [Pararobbsia silviterrae]